MRQERQYRAIRDCHEEYHYPIEAACKILHVSRAAYYKWKGGQKSRRAMENERLAELVEEIHNGAPDIAENVLKREYHAEKPNEKWLTDVTEFKYYIGSEKHKVYLSAILDLYDRRIVSFDIRDTNDNMLVIHTFDKAVETNPDAHPLFHSDRGYQYTSRTFHRKL